MESKEYWKMECVMKNVIIEIKSKIDQQEGEVHQIDLTTEGEWFEKNDAIFIVYYESEVSGMQGCKTMLKIQNESITMTRFGESNSKIVFNKSEPMSSVYKTPYGAFDMSVFTESLDYELKEYHGHIHIAYKMILEKLSNSENVLNINIRPA